MGADDLSLQRYSESCKAVAADYIERSTRFNVKHLRVLSAQSVMRSFQVSIRHDLEVVSDARDHHGVHHPGPDDFSSADWAWYQEQVALQAQSEFYRPETMDALVGAIKDGAYAAIATRTCIRTHPRRFFHSYKCSGCHGTGKVTCHGCSGSGEVACGWCAGSGRTSCGTCHGSGTLSETRQVTDYNGYSRSETQHRSCSYCSGGRVRCSSCGGSGCQSCSTCGGSGKLTCTGCSGHGYLTKITTTQTYTNPAFGGIYPDNTPDYVHSALSKVGFATLEKFGRIALNEVNVSREKSAAQFIYDCSMPFCELSIEVAGRTSHWVLFGDTPCVFDAGGALEALLQSDYAMLAAVAGGGQRCLPWFHRAARGAVAPFMESELNQELIDASTRGLAPAAIVEALNRSVSEVYVQQSLANLKTTVQTATNWSRAKGLVTVALLSLPCAVALLAYLERGHRREAYAPLTQLFIHEPGSSAFVWEIGFMALPFAVAGWLISAWASRRWLRKAGGKRTVAWAEGNGLLMGKWTGITVVLTAVASTGAFFSRWPVWIDTEGKAYGVVALFEPPQIRQPVAPTVDVVEAKRPAKKKKKKEAPKPTATGKADERSSQTPPALEGVPQRESRPREELF